jgi:CMP-N,N'-diacetyllegionaminic acid synthase
MRDQEMAPHTPTIIALIPARSGSKRVPGKNIRRLGEHPLLAYSIAAARVSGVFSRIVVSTDSPEYAEIAVHYGAEVPFLRPLEIAGDTSPDIEWVRDVLQRLSDIGEAFDCFSILRPTSPFRTGGTILRAWSEFNAESGIDSLRAIEKCRQHPGKMWVVRNRRMMPLLPLGPEDQPWHSSQYSSLPEVWVQNASLEIAWTRTVTETGTIAGATILPFVTRGMEGFDVNNEDDWLLAEARLRLDPTILPQIDRPPFERQR